ncbi:hypothetical protein DM860_016176 [Cuscuta australis]|uniref:Uncharacterized protein n=1 Tax=Cuscuta australis TaxID=267555 RepID=A0A328E320_9ASTE|nr:hypothetical protein DM860_016176 [Cuscuta australis]
MLVVMMGLAINHQFGETAVEKGTLVFRLLFLFAACLLLGLTSFLIRFMDIGGDLKYVLNRSKTVREAFTRWLQGLGPDQAAVLGLRAVRLEQTLNGIGDFRRGYYLQALFTSLVALFPILMIIFL